ncbi:MAG: hypothetical protein ACI4DO_03980 [Roseburia sp.]
MACFIVPAAEAVATTIVAKVMESKESKQTQRENSAEAKIPVSKKVKNLSGFLWGGSALLAFEHIWHGEIVPFFPFLSAASNPTDAMEMLHEMGTVGVGMAAAVTVFWAIITFASDRIAKRHSVMQPEKR